MLSRETPALRTHLDRHFLAADVAIRKLFAAEKHAPFGAVTAENGG